MNYLIPNIKIYKKERIYDFNLEEYIYEIKPEFLSKYKLKVVHNEPNIFWRQKTWDLAIYRSMEIWRKIPANKLENSIGELTTLAKRSLSGKWEQRMESILKKIKTIIGII